MRRTHCIIRLNFPTVTVLSWFQKAKNTLGWKPSKTLEDIIGGVRSACTYIGARRIKDMAKCASFVTTHNVINRVYEQYTI